MNSKWNIATEKISETPSSRIYQTTVSQDGDKYTFEVTVDRDYVESILGANAPDILLIQQSFMFLLDNEPVTAILRNFNIREIQNYFPEYENVMLSVFS